MSPVWNEGYSTDVAYTHDYYGDIAPYKKRHDALAQQKAHLAELKTRHAHFMQVALPVLKALEVA